MIYFPGYAPDGKAITASGSSARTSLGNTPLESAASTVLVDNRGAADLFVRLGDATVVATTLSLRVPAGQCVGIGKAPGNTHIAYITGGDAGQGVVHLGEGV